MDDDFNNDSMLELYLFESTTLLDSLDAILLAAEAVRELTSDNINEIFRIMHTIKGSSAMMAFNAIADVSHKTEDLFAAVRDNGIEETRFDALFDLLLKVSKFLEGEVEKIQSGAEIIDGNPDLIEEISDFTATIHAATSSASIPDLGRTLGVAPDAGKDTAFLARAGITGGVISADAQHDPLAHTGDFGDAISVGVPAGFFAHTGTIENAMVDAGAQGEPFTHTADISGAGADPEIRTESVKQKYPQSAGFRQPEPLNPEIYDRTAIPAIQKQRVFQGAAQSPTLVAPEGGRILGIDLPPVPAHTKPHEHEVEIFEPLPKSDRLSGPGSLACYNIHVHFNEGAKMENIRAYMLVNKLSEMGTVNRTIPSNLENGVNVTEHIVENGLYISFTTSMFREQIETVAKGTLSVESVTFVRRMPDEGDALELPAGSAHPLGDIASLPVSAPSEKTDITGHSAHSATESLALSGIQLSEQADSIARHDNARAATKSPARPDAHHTQPGTGSAAGEKTSANGHMETAPQNQNAPSGDEHPADAHKQGLPARQNLISVDITKLDTLLDLVGEIVINESMVTGNPDLEGLELSNFQKSARQLNKLTDELQDTVMSVRMVPVSMIFQRMRRIVRDMGKNLGKQVELILVDEQTEVDKTILDALGDPLMHLIRNAMDHAIEMPDERVVSGKRPTGRIVLSAQNVGGDVLISVSDDGRGMDREKILNIATRKGLLKKHESEYTSKEIYNLVMAPGFSTKTDVSEYSGRGVGMDVVKMNIEQIGGSVIIESAQGAGTNVMMKIPLTLAIIDCIEIALGDETYAIPITNIRESFKASAGQLISDPLSNEMILLRGSAYPIIRLHETFRTQNAIKNLNDGILLLVDSGDRVGCLLADGLIGKFQIVVKPIPSYLNRYKLKSAGISGCTIMGNGEIGLIVDVQELLS